MTDQPVLIAIGERYTGLAESNCCLSCGGAIDLAEPKPGEKCVDLGSGRGQDVLRMAEAVGPDGYAWGIDTSAGMLRKARRTAQKLGVENAEFIECPLEKIKLPSEVVDLVISNCTVNHARDKVSVWGEIFRILKPGGRFVVSDIYSLQEVPEEYANDPVAISECWAGSVERSVYLQTLQDAGFTDIQVLEESDPYPKGHIEVASFTVAGTRPGGGSSH